MCANRKNRNATVGVGFVRRFERGEEGRVLGRHGGRLTLIRLEAFPFGALLAPLRPSKDTVYAYILHRYITRVCISLLRIYMRVYIHSPRVQFFVRCRVSRRTVSHSAPVAL